MDNEIVIKDSDFKEKFLENFSALRPDLFLSEIYENPADAALVAEEIKPARTRTAMYSSIPMTCTTSQCPFADTCPLQQKGLAPKGKPCPIEMAIVSDLMQSFMEELKVDPNSMNEVLTIRDLVDTEIQHLRKSKYLAKEDIVQNLFMGTDQKGNPIFNPSLHVVVDLEDRLLKRKKDIRNQLVASRQAKLQAGQGALDTAQKLSKIMDNIRKWDQEQHDNLNMHDGKKIDEYIEADIAKRKELENKDI